MQFNVAQLLKASVGGQRHHTLEETIDPLVDASTSHVRGTLRFMRTERGIWVAGRLMADAEATCSRCLEACRYTLHLDLDEEWFPTVDVLTGARLPIPEGREEAFTIDEHHTLDLREAVRQYTIMNVPMKPLCRESCPGICPHCGAQRKYDPCQCAEAVADPRWSPILSLLVQGQY